MNGCRQLFMSALCVPVPVPNITDFSSFSQLAVVGLMTPNSQARRLRLTGRWPPSEEQPAGKPGASPTFLQTFVGDWAPLPQPLHKGSKVWGATQAGAQGHADTSPHTAPEALPHLGGLWSHRPALKLSGGPWPPPGLKKLGHWPQGSGIHLPHLSSPLLTSLGRSFPAFCPSFPILASLSMTGGGN